jgi:HK97 family phage major capsid protein/HK97 family phage prohead protease
VADRAYSLLTIKAVSEDAREITGIATTPSTDRMGDIVEPKGAQFSLPLPLLWQHDARSPIGHVTHARITPDGIEIKARIVKIDEPGPLKDRLDTAWQSIKSGLVQGLSVGFQALESARIEGTGGLRFIKWAWHELSAVTIPANQEASITAIRSFDAQHLAPQGTEAHSVRILTSPAAVGSANPKVRKGTSSMAKKTYADQIRDLENTKTAAVQKREEIQTKAAEAGRTKDAAEREEFDTLTQEIAGIDAELKDLRELEKSALANTETVSVAGQQSVPARSVASATPFVQVKANVPQGIGFARMALARVAAHKFHMPALDIAKQRWPDHSELHAALTFKATIPAGLSTGSSAWAGNLVDQTNLSSEFLAYLRPQTLVGKFGVGNVPALRNLPFNVRITGQTTGAVAGWVGEGKPKPVTSFSTNAQTLLYTKIAAIAVISQELARFSTPSAEAMVRDELARAVTERMDIDFIDPSSSAVAGVNPASITQGLTPLTSAGVSADNARTDLISILSYFVENHANPSRLVLVMPATLALALSLMRNSLGQQEFPGLTLSGGTLEGIPVITSQYAANASGSGNLVVGVNTEDVGIADDGEVTVDASTEASVQMSDAPTNDASTGTGQSLVSLWQTNSIGIRAERFVNWAKLRSTAVVLMDDVNWGSVGSPS